MQIIDLFAGIGASSLAGHWMGWETKCFVEIDPFCQKVLNKNFHGVHIHSDIKNFGIENLKTTSWNPSADTIVCGGFP